jgi:mTERF domain-containing protein, mitochondrial
MMDFLTKEAWMDMEAIAPSQRMLKLSIEGRLAPRLKVLKLLKAKGLQGHNSQLQLLRCGLLE